MNIIRKTFLFVNMLGLGIVPMLAGTAYDMDLIKAVEKSQSRQISYYIGQGADVNVRVGTQKKTPLMFAIDAAAKEAEKSVSIGKGIASIMNGVVLGVAGLGGIALLSPILRDPEFNRDLNNVKSGTENTMLNQGRRGIRSVTNDIESRLEKPEDKVPNSYKNVIKIVPNPRHRVIGLLLTTMALSAGVGYGIFKIVSGPGSIFVGSVRDFMTYRSRLSTIKILLEAPLVDVSAADANGQTALDLVHNYMVHSKNKNVLNIMKQIETMILEKQQPHVA